MNPVFKYNGGKARIAEATIAFFPPRKLWRTYVEPFGGAYSIGFAMRPAPHEIYNDIDDRLGNFFRVMVDTPLVLIRKLRWTLYSQKELDRCRLRSSNPIEDARRFYVLCWQSFGANKDNCAYRHKGNTSSPGGHNPARNFRNSIERLFSMRDRFQNIHVSCEDWSDFLPRFFAAKDALIYVDPPYEDSVRSGGDLYRHELKSPLEHARIARAARRCRGYVVVAGYASRLYERLYECHGWERRDIKTHDNAKKLRIESIWLNPKIIQDAGSQVLFG